MFEVQQNLLIQMQYVPCHALPLRCYLASYRLCPSFTVSVFDLFHWVFLPLNCIYNVA